MLRILVSGLSLAIAILSTSTAQAHTALVRSKPTSGAHEQVSPATIELLFGADVRLIDLRLTSDGGTPIQLEKSRDLVPSQQFTIALPPLGADGYRVDWVVMGGDSHKMTGSFDFTVGTDVER